MPDTLNGRVCCLLQICCDATAARTNALSAMLVKYRGMDTESAALAADFVVQNFGIVPLDVQAQIVDEVRKGGGKKDHCLVRLDSYAPHVAQAAAESATLSSGA